jgi:hypothetical protein
MNLYARRAVQKDGLGRCDPPRVRNLQRAPVWRSPSDVLVAAWFDLGGRWRTAEIGHSSPAPESLAPA